MQLHLEYEVSMRLSHYDPNRLHTFKHGLNLTTSKEKALIVFLFKAGYIIFCWTHSDFVVGEHS
jgi:hypothetical protein